MTQFSDLSVILSISESIIGDVLSSTVFKPRLIRVHSKDLRLIHPENPKLKNKTLFDGRFPIKHKPRMKQEKYLIRNTRQKRIDKQ